MEGRRTINYFQWIRACGAVAIVLLHAFVTLHIAGEGSLSPVRVGIEEALSITLTRWAVPAFFMVSGALMLDPSRTMGWDKILRHVWRLVFVLLTFGLAFALVESISNQHFVVDAQENSAECAQVLSYCDKLFIGNVGVDGESQRNVLTVPSDIAHAGERLAVPVAFQSALVSEIVIVRIIPLELNVSVLHHLRDPAGKFLIQRIVAVHQADASVRSAQLVQDIVLIHILTALRAVPQIESALCLAHVYRINLVFAHKIPPFLPLSIPIRQLSAAHTNMYDPSVLYLS